MKSVEYANIDKVTITNVPAGWNVDLQKGDNEATLTVTAPLKASPDPEQCVSI